MTPAEAIEYFGDRRAVAQVCKISEQAVSKWRRLGFIPYDKQCLLQVESERAPRKRRKRLVASWHDIPDKRAA